MWMNFSLRKSIFIWQLSSEWRPPRGKPLGLDSQNFSLHGPVSALRICREGGGGDGDGGGGWVGCRAMTNPLSFLCVQVLCTMSPHQHIPLPVSVPVPLAFIFPDPPLQVFFPGHRSCLFFEWHASPNSRKLPESWSPIPPIYYLVPIIA